MPAREKGLRESTLRNGGFGFIIGSLYVTFKYHRMKENENDFEKFKRHWVSYLTKFPLFISTFTILYKVKLKLKTNTMHTNPCTKYVIYNIQYNI